MKKLLFTFVLLALAQAALAQIRGRVVDVKSGEPIPYANILINNSDNQISNGEGYFTIPEANASENTTLQITCMGYAGIQITVGQLQSRDSVVKLDEVSYELDNVNLADRPTAAYIMAQVKSNLKNNYTLHPTLAKDQLFLREVNTFTPSKFEVEITKSTGFTKGGLKEANAEIKGYMQSLVTHPPKGFTDLLGNYYTSPKTDDATKTYYSKLDVVQATKMHDENRSTSLDDMQEKATKLMLKHLDTTKYYRIKSGWFGSRDTVSLRRDYNKKKNAKNKVNNVTNAKTRLSSIRTESNFLYGEKMQFIKEPDIYDYTYEGTVFLSDGSYAYVLKFEPRKGRALYRGKIYVSESDYAVLRADYELYPGRKVDGLNVKLILGIKYSENVSSGTVIFKKDPVADGYYLQYASKTTGQYFYVNRPLKFIELTDEEKDVVAFDFKIEGNILEKSEFLNMSRTAVSEENFSSIKEDDFTYKKIKKYDASLWTKYGAIEPLEEMKRYQVGEESPN